MTKERLRQHFFSKISDVLLWSADEMTGLGALAIRKWVLKLGRDEIDDEDQLGEMHIEFVRAGLKTTHE